MKYRRILDDGFGYKAGERRVETLEYSAVLIGDPG